MPASSASMQLDSDTRPLGNPLRFFQRENCCRNPLSAFVLARFILPNAPSLPLGALTVSEIAAVLINERSDIARYEYCVDLTDDDCVTAVIEQTIYRAE